MQESDINHLKQGEWLNNEVIKGYVALCHEGSGEYMMSSWSYPKPVQYYETDKEGDVNDLVSVVTASPFPVNHSIFSLCFWAWLFLVVDMVVLISR